MSVNTITETCGCGATFAVTAAYASYAREAASAWRTDHQHVPVIEPGLCWAPPVETTWPSGMQPRCGLRAGHSGAHECDQPLGGTTIWPNETEETR